MLPQKTFWVGHFQTVTVGAVLRFVTVHTRRYTLVYGQFTMSKDDLAGPFMGRARTVTFCTCYCGTLFLGPFVVIILVTLHALLNAYGFDRLNMNTGKFFRVGHDNSVTIHAYFLLAAADMT